jgi:hypothetical protein
MKSLGLTGAAATVPEKKVVDPHFEEIVNGPNVDVTKH